MWTEIFLLYDTEIWEKDSDTSENKEKNLIITSNASSYNLILALFLLEGSGMWNHLALITFSHVTLHGNTPGVISYYLYHFWKFRKF